MFAPSKWTDEQVSRDLRASPIEYGLIAALLAVAIIMSAATARTQIASTFNHSSPTGTDAAGCNAVSALHHSAGEDVA
jgi:Flp pilus assembly pilin Flp